MKFISYCTETKAKVIEKDSLEETDVSSHASFFRPLESDEDPKYLGKIVSREELNQESYLPNEDAEHSEVGYVIFVNCS